MDLLSNKYTLLNKNLYKMIELSMNCEQSDMKNLWDIIQSQRLNQITSLKELLKGLCNIFKSNQEKEVNTGKILNNLLNQMSKEIFLCIKSNYLNNISESNFNDLACLLLFPLLLNDLIYNIFHCINENINNLPQFFFSLVDESLNVNNQIYRDNLNEWSSNLLIIIQHVKKLISLDMISNTRFLFDSNLFSSKNMRIKLDTICKVEIN